MQCAYLEYDDATGGELVFPGGGDWICGLANEKSKTIRRLKIRSGDVIDQIEWGIGYLDNSEITYHVAGGNTGI